MSMTSTLAGQTEEFRSRPGAEGRHSTFTLRDFLIAAFFHVRIVLLAALVPIGLGVAAATLSKTEYTASSLVMVIVSREVSNDQNVTGNGPSVLSIEGLKQVESEVQIIESADVIRSVIEGIGPDRLFKPGLFSGLRDMLSSNGSVMDRSIERFRRNLRVEVLDDSNVVQVSYTSPDRDLAIEAANKLVEVYMARRRAIMQNPTARILMNEVDRFKRQLADTDKSIEALKARVGIIDFDQDAVLAANQVDAVVQRRRQVAERKVAVAGQIAEAERQLKALPSTVLDFNQKSDALGNDDDNNALSRLLIERDKLATQYAPNGSMMREINRQIDTIREQIATRKDRSYETSRDVRNPAIGYVNNMVLSLRIEQDALTQQEKELAQQQADAEKRLATLRTAETDLVELNRRRDTLNDGYREYLRRATAAQIEEAAAAERESNVRLIQDAGAAVTNRSMRLPFLAAGLLGGLLFGAAAGAVASALRSSFIMPAEAERALALPLLGEVGNQSRADDPEATQRDIAVLASLLLDTQVDEHAVRAIQFVAPGPDEALSPLAAGIATEITVQRGLRTLLVDLSAEEAPVADPAAREKGGLMVMPTPTPLLWSLAGREGSALLDVRLPANEARRLMDELGREFEAMVFCSTAQDPAGLGSRIAALVDGNVVVLRAEKTRKAQAVALGSAIMENGGVPLGFVFLGRRYLLPDWIYRLT
ncbi:exopolysaccharide transport family protein [Ancylobacter mangrovi]|uniref:exopolysaccharide transport family protein n=1 Tax=Ancylobacter mangrovi TaxID=2972472 RepID=UPI002161E6F6|nr:lipopolysaccharide biosynthesis protein [Ancylobacter mangrovi]MCS0504456.1 lipopolysaccharide biosynthesis protein [Ancylobacter mangrovi]